MALELEPPSFSVPPPSRAHTAAVRSSCRARHRPTVPGRTRTCPPWREKGGSSGPPPQMEQGRRRMASAARSCCPPPKRPNQPVMARRGCVIRRSAPSFSALAWLAAAFRLPAADRPLAATTGPVAAAPPRPSLLLHGRASPRQQQGRAAPARPAGPLEAGGEKVVGGDVLQGRPRGEGAERPLVCSSTGRQDGGDRDWEGRDSRTRAGPTDRRRRTGGREEGSWRRRKQRRRGRERGGERMRKEPRRMASDEIKRERETDVWIPRW
ncbi:hypothetical protein PVAP13_1NG395219 [Panicum virgatum]|uniref:Uncharacterized protein n=1 Tax=Panicum virgatum TaxID=38727 RepID=A0A8T0X6E4_PANVG|nr:hypothetical protein PVAP13_1NG395219 [Panicum virgatum]